MPQIHPENPSHRPQIEGRELLREFTGWKLIRPIGQGGFSEVWLAQFKTTSEFRSLKFISASRQDHLQKEYHALLTYCRSGLAESCSALIPIEHVELTTEGLFYIMPLADGMPGTPDELSPSHPDWQPCTLAALIEAQHNQPAWFPILETIAWMSRILGALQKLSDAGLVHRDVKPDNILFFKGQPVLGDIGLVSCDSVTVTRRGTPGYLAPSWYKGGHPDMYGAAATLYHLLTGYPPDTMGRSAFKWPPQGKQSFSIQDQVIHERLHKVIGRAMQENPSERFQDFNAMRVALEQAMAPYQSHQVAQPPPLPESAAQASSTASKPKVSYVSDYEEDIPLVFGIRMLWMGLVKATEFCTSNRYGAIIAGLLACSFAIHHLINDTGHRVWLTLFGGFVLTMRGLTMRKVVPNESDGG